MAQSSPTEAVISQECRNAEDKRGERGGGGGGIETPTRGGVVRFSAGMGEQQRPYPATIRYNKHLLRKRLDVEEWMDNQIRLLYDFKVKPTAKISTEEFYNRIFSLYQLFTVLYIAPQIHDNLLHMLSMSCEPVKHCICIRSIPHKWGNST